MYKDEFKLCTHCGRSFGRGKSGPEGWSRRRFCSTKCMGLAKRVPPEHKRRVLTNWRAATREKRRIANKAWAANHQEHLREYQRAYRSKHKDRLAQQRAQHYRDTIDQHRERKRRYVERIGKQGLQLQRQRAYLRNPERFKQNRRNREARLRGPAGKHTAADVAALCKRQKYRCAHCRVSVRRYFHVDHIIPIAKGGTNWPTNLQILCERCNSQKRHSVPGTLDFMRVTGLLL
jgi:5-methylcytosine-specific restriction endonuclease McrA